jgi:hypothetical protein
MHRRWGKITSLGLLCLFLLPLLFLLGEHVRGSFALSHCKKELLAQGEKFSPQDSISPSQPGDNGAPVLMEATAQLNGAVTFSNTPPCMNILPSGRAIVGFHESQWAGISANYRWSDVALAMETNAAILDKIRTALNRPVLDNQLDYSQGYLLLLPHLSRAKQMVFWFGARSQLALRSNQPHQGLADLMAELQLLRWLEQDHLAISELVRLAIASFARTHTWEALQAGGWTDEDLAALQEAWSRSNFVSPMRHALEVELSRAPERWACMRRSDKILSEVLALSSPGWVGAFQTIKTQQVYHAILRFAWLDQNQVHYLMIEHQALQAARRAETNRSLQAGGPALRSLRTANVFQSGYDMLRFPIVFDMISPGKGVERSFRIQTEQSIIITAIALKRYAVRHGKAPASLEALVPDFLSAVPIDYMDGKPVKYHLKPDGSFVLYSVGDDGHDDGGDASQSPADPDHHGRWDRKDFVWPSPATAAEVEQYRRDAAAR